MWSTERTCAAIESRSSPKRSVIRTQPTSTLVWKATPPGPPSTSFRRAAADVDDQRPFSDRVAGRDAAEEQRSSSPESNEVAKP
jgi:hypothetical protein